MTNSVQTRGFTQGPSPRIAVVVPCYRVGDRILDVVRSIGPLVDDIFVVDDACPDNSGIKVQTEVSDSRVRVIFHGTNQGVGGAVITGYLAAIHAGAQVIVKIDGDGQMDASLIPHFVAPIIHGRADYTKGNRFYDLRHVLRMPLARLLGNAALSFMAKLSTGYWNIFDPTNGFTAIHVRVAERIPHAKVSRRFFFETDLLFRLGTMRCVVMDVPMDAVYGPEKSNLQIRRVILEFGVKHLRNTLSRLFYNYLLRDFSVASCELAAGAFLAGFGFVFGVLTWASAVRTGESTPVGTIMLAVMPSLVGIQLLLAFVSYDMAAVPRQPLSSSLEPVNDRPFTGEGDRGAS